MTEYAYPGDITNVVQLFTYMNTITNDYYWTMFLVTVFFIITMVLRNFGIKRNLSYAFFSTFVLTIFLYPYGLVSEMMLFITSIGTAVIVVSAYIED